MLQLLDIISVWGIREPFSTLSHALGALLALGATVLLVRRAWNEGGKGQAVAVYGATVVLAFAASALFHYVTVSPSRLDLYKQVDHVAIFLVMGGTGTAIYSTLGSYRADQLVAATWALIIFAITVELMVGSLGDWGTIAIYLAAGWTCSLGLFVIARSVNWRRLRSFATGVLVFSLGALVFATEWPVVWPGVIEGHEVFHVLVLIGEAFHFHFVYRYCTCPTLLCEEHSEAKVRVGLSPSELET